VLKVLATQGAISLENIGLYRALADREAKVRHLVDANIIGTFIWKVAGPHSDAYANDVLIVEANDAFLNMVGYDRADIAAGRLSRSALSLPEWRDRDASTMEEVKKTGTVQPFEKEYLRKDGSRVPVLLGFVAFDDRRIEGYAFVLDLTERKRAEEALRESERNARLIVDSIPGLVGILDSNGDIEAVNRQILEYYGKTLEELKKHWPDLVHPPDLPRVIEVLTQSIASGEPFEVEFRARRFDGVYRWLQNRGFPLRDVNDRIVRWYNLLIDIDERKAPKRHCVKASEVCARQLTGYLVSLESWPQTGTSKPSIAKSLSIVDSPWRS
jgi:PAS domain S-box-containing protein